MPAQGPAIVHDLTGTLPRPGQPSSGKLGSRAAPLADLLGSGAGGAGPATAPAPAPTPAPAPAAGPAEPPGLECGCCYGEYGPTEMAQCSTGHLFCKTCVGALVKEAVFGSGKLDCMSTGEPRCTAVIPMSEVRRACDPELYESLISKQQHESLQAAQMSGLVRCPKPDCGYAMVMEGPNLSNRFRCNKCGAETCRLCQKDWADHIGLRCEEVETDDATTARRKVEEEMTNAMMRTCPGCGVPFAKIEGCNKMTCRCGAVTCYVCRQPIVVTGKGKRTRNSYAHFCQHPRDPGKECSKCNKCSLWSSAEEDDALRIREAKQRAEREVGHKLNRHVQVGPQG